MYKLLREQVDGFGNDKKREDMVKKKDFEYSLTKWVQFDLPFISLFFRTLFSFTILPCFQMKYNHIKVYGKIYKIKYFVSSVSPDSRIVRMVDTL